MRLNLVMNRSVRVFFSLDSSTSFKILLAAESEAGRRHRISSTAEVLIAPEKTSFPSKTSTGTDSPVSAELFMSDFPFETFPSTGILSPGFTITVSPGFTSSAFI